MATTRETAKALLEAHAQTTAVPALSEAEVNLCLDMSRVADDDGLFTGDADYTETIWATWAICQALDLKLAKAATLVDFNADGATVAQSQITANLTAARRRWMGQMIPGSL